MSFIQRSKLENSVEKISNIFKKRFWKKMISFVDASYKIVDEEYEKEQSQIINAEDLRDDQEKSVTPNLKLLSHFNTISVQKEVKASIIGKKNKFHSTTHNDQFQKKQFHTVIQSIEPFNQDTTQNPLIMQEEQVNNEEQEILDQKNKDQTQQIQKNISIKSQKKVNTLHFGDIVFLQCNNYEKKDGKTTGQLTFFYIIGNTMNNIDCVSDQAQSLDNPISHFRRCLFRLVNPRDYFDYSSYVYLKKKGGGDIFKAKENYEKEKQYCNEVVYGQDILFIHEYSKMLLTMRPDTPAKQNGCFEVDLEINGDAFSIFQILPIDKLKQKGQKIFDSDVVLIKETKLNNYYIHAEDEKSESQAVRFDINGSEQSSQFKIKCYIANSELNIDQSNQEKQFYRTGDIVAIEHLETGGLLTVSEKKLSAKNEKFFKSKTCKVLLQGEESNYNGQEAFFTLRQMDSNRVMSPENLEVFFDFIDPIKNTMSSYSAWEIQRKDNFQGGSINVFETFRFKNLATGLFLIYDRTEHGKLKLTYNAREQDCYFNVKKCKTLNDPQKIFTNDTLKIFLQQTQSTKYFTVSTIQDKDKQKLNFQLSNKFPGDSKPYVFRFNQCNTSLLKFIEQTFSIYHTLLKFHFFLQNFAIDIDKSKIEEKDTVIYDYRKAVQTQKELEKEALDVIKCLELLKQLLLQNNNELDFQLTQKQNILSEQKHLELILLIAKLIDTMIYAIYNKQQKEKTRLVKIYNRNQPIKIPEKSPQFIAKRYLQNIPGLIYQILQISCQKNEECSQFIYENDDFFSGQLRYYPNEVQALLKEAIGNLTFMKNLEKIQDKSGDNQSEEIIEWVKQLDVLDESKQNIQDQIFYADIISKSLIDPQGNPLVKYQHKCCVEIFNKGKGGKSKALIEFGLSEGQPAIVFYKLNTLTEFMQENQSLQKLKNIKLNDFEDQACYLVEELCHQSKQKRELNLFINYAASVIKLYANLCKGRKTKSIQKIKSLGISESHIFMVLKNPDININLKNSYFLLYQDIYLDVDPFLPLAKSEKRNFIWNNLNIKLFNQRTMLIFEQYTDITEINKQSTIFDENLRSIIVDFWEYGIPELEVGNTRTQNKYKLFNNTSNQEISNFNQYEDPIQDKVDLFLCILKITRTSIDLGYLNSETIEQIIINVIQVFEPYVKIGSSSDNIIKPDHWIQKFIAKAIEHNAINGEIDEYLDHIIIEISKLIRLYMQIKKNFQIIHLLNNFFNDFENFSDRKKEVDLLLFSKNIISKLILKNQHHYFKEHYQDITNDPEKEKLLGDSRLNSNMSFSEEDLTESIQIDTSIQNIILTILVIHKGIGSKGKYQHLLDTFIQNSMHIQTLSYELKMLNLISGEEEIKLYKELEGNQLVSQIVSPSRLEIQVNTILFDEENNKAVNLNSKKSSERMLEINNLLNKIVYKMKELKSDARLFKKTQNILRNLGVHKSILKLLILNPSDKVFQDTFTRMISFFVNFCKDNSLNQLQLLSIFDNFLILLKYDLNVQKLLGILLRNISDKEEVQVYLNKILQKFSQSDEKDKVEQIHILQLLHNFLLCDPINDGQMIFKNQVKRKSEKPYIIRNQQIILTQLLKNQNHLQLIKDFRNIQDIIKNFLADEQKKEQIPVDIILYKELIGAIGNSTVNYPLGVHQCQRIFVYEEIKTLISKHQSQNFISAVPYVIKKENLRILYQIYIEDIEGINNNFTIIEMNDIIYHVVLTDLSNYQKYLDGIIKKVDKRCTEHEQEQYKNNTKKLNELITQKINEAPVQEEKNIGNMKSINQNKQIIDKDMTDILVSNTEYWDYLYGGNNWNHNKDGLLLFIIDIYYFINKKNWMQFEHQADKISTPEEEQLSEQLLILKILLEKIRNTLKLIEKLVGISLTQYINLMSKGILLNPVRRTLKTISGNKLGTKFNINQNEKLFKDNGLLTLNITKEERKEFQKKFFEKIRLLILDKVFTLQDMLRYFDVSKDSMDDDINDELEGGQNLITKEEFMNIMYNLLDPRGCFGGVKQQEKSRFIDFDDMNEFFAAITGTDDLQYARKKEKILLEKKKFLNNLKNYIESKKNNYNKEALKNDNISSDVNEATLSIQKSRSLINYMNSFATISMKVEEKNAYQRIAQTILQEMVKQNERDKKIFMNNFFNQILLLLQYGQTHFMEIFNFFIQELNIIQGTHLHIQSSMVLGIKEQDKIDDQNQKSNSQCYRIVQTILQNNELYFYLFKCLDINLNNSKQSYIALKIINKLLVLNLKNSCQQIINNIKKINQIENTRNFFLFIQQSLIKYIQLVDQSQTNSKNLEGELKLQEDIVTEIFIFIFQTCEHCNDEFQNIFREQIFPESKSYISVNVVIEIIYFLINLSKYRSSYFKVFKNSQITFQNLRFYQLINQSFLTLKNLTNGTFVENKIILIENIPFLTFLNAIISESHIDIESETLRDIKTLQTVSSAIELLLTIVKCYNNQEALLRLISKINLEKLTQIANYIYQRKLKHRLNFIFQERLCNHTNSMNCSISFCEKDYMTQHDELILKLAFNIVITIQLLLDLINEEALAVKLRMQEENTIILGVFLEIKNKEHFMKLMKESEQNSNQNTNSNSQQTKKQQKSLLKKRTLIQSKVKQQAMNSSQRQKIPKEIDQINEDYQNEEIISNPEKVSGQTKKSYQTIQQEREFLKESLMFYMKFLGQVEILKGFFYCTKKLVKEKKTQFFIPNIFFLLITPTQIIIKIKKDKELSMMFFRIPFLSNYISDNIKHNLERETLSLPNKSRLEMLIKFSDYFQHEMRYGQRISHYPYLQFSIRYSDIQKDIVFILIIFINAFFIIDMRQDEEGQHSLSPIFFDIYEVFAIIHIGFSCTTVVIEMIERFPLLAYFKGMVLEKRKPQGIVQISIMFLRDGETMYYVIYLILTSAALITPLFYSLLLVDWIKRSQDVIEILKALTHKYQKILKTLFLQLIYIYCYALLGFIYLAQDYYENQLGITLFDGHLYYLFSSTLLYGLIESQGINGILKIRDIKDSLYWTRFVLDLTFWIVINFYLTNLLLGVIIDTFAELRAIQKSQDKNLQGKCFICGLSQEDFEARTLDWSTHNKTEHNLYNYLNYIIYIKNKDIKDCDGLEKYVKECILNGKTDFFPKRDTLSFHRNAQNNEI